MANDQAAKDLHRVRDLVVNWRREQAETLARNWQDETSMDPTFAKSLIAAQDTIDALDKMIKDERGAGSPPSGKTSFL